MYNPEELLLKKQAAPEEELCPNEEKVYHDYVLSYKKESVKIDNFSDIYPEIKIKRDVKRVAEIKEKFWSGKTERSEILEAILARQIEQANWFGENCSVVRTSEYDDLVNHTDLVAEFEEEGIFIRLALDVTTSQDKDTLADKIRSIEKEIDQGKLTSLEYYLSEETEPPTKGRLEMVPRVIIGTDREGVKELSDLVKKTIDQEKGSNLELANSQVQIELLTEVKEQLEYFIDYAKEKKAAPFLINQQKKVLKIIERALENKKSSIGPTNRARQNDTYQFLSSL